MQHDDQQEQGTLDNVMNEIAGTPLVVGLVGFTALGDAEIIEDAIR